MKREQIPSMSALPLPFALNGETSIPVKELDPFLDDGNLGSLGFDGKYQWNGNTPPSRFITRQLMNRLLGQISGRQFLKQCGVLDTFDQNVCDAIGGYPQGAVLQYLDGDILYDVVSMRDNNDTDYTNVGVDGINWRIYGSSVFSYVYPDYGSVGQDNILKRWEISSIGDWKYQFFDSSYGDIYFVSDLKLVDVQGVQRWQITLNYIDSPDVVFGTKIDPNATPTYNLLQFGWPDFYVQARKSSQVSSDALTITSHCWIQAFITNPTAAHGMTNYECGIALYNESTASPSAIEDLKVDNTNYTVYELEEIGTIATAVLPVLPGNKISAFASKTLSEDREIIIRKLTPVRTR